MIPRIFEGQSVFICAGGPSLRGFQFERLRGTNVIAINRANELMPFAPVLWWTDAMFWRKHKDSLLRHPAPWKATCQMEYRPTDAVPDTIHTYQFSGLTGFDDRPGHLRHGNNSAYAAMHLAVHLGARKLILLGVDMCHGADGATHFHSGHGVLHHERTLTQLMLPHFATLAPALAERGIAVLNASERSRLTVWPRCSIEEGLAAYGCEISKGAYRS